jgi:hypothetical protein
MLHFVNIYNIHFIILIKLSTYITHFCNTNNANIKTIRQCLQTNPTQTNNKFTIPCIDVNIRSNN